MNCKWISFKIRKCMTATIKGYFWDCQNKDDSLDRLSKTKKIVQEVIEISFKSIIIYTRIWIFIVGNQTYQHLHLYMFSQIYQDKTHSYFSHSKVQDMSFMFLMLTWTNICIQLSWITRIVFLAMCKSQQNK